MHTPGLAAAIALCLGGAALSAPSFVEMALDAGLDHTFAPTGYPGEHGTMHAGGAVADFNADGWPDIFLVSGGTEPDRLYINMGDGTFAEQAALWGVDATHRGAGVAVGDINRDGLPDLFVMSLGDADAPAAMGDNKLYISNGPDAFGQHTFTEQAAEAGLASLSPFLDGMGTAFGDYDLDGDLDLLACHWFNVPNNLRLMTNNGDGTFTDASATLPQPSKNHRGFQPRFVDLNNDRFPEIVVTGDFNTSVLYVNRGLNGDGSHAGWDLRRDESGITIDCNAMGSAIADFNADGLLDWYITNIYTPPPANSCGNVLYVNTGIDPAGTPVFSEESRTRGVYDGGWGWGTVAADFDHDADLDIAATGGWPTWAPVPSRLFLNDGTAHFTEAAAASGFTFTGNGRGLVALDFDNDGDLDLLLIANNGRARLFENTTALGHWLRVDVTNHTHPCLAPGGYGTLVRATTGGATQIRPLDGQYSYLSQGQQTAHFGLGAAAAVDTLEVLWADGSVTTLHDVPAGQILHLTARHPADFDADDAVSMADAPGFIDAFLAASPAADLNTDGAVNLDDLDALIGFILDGPCP